MSMLRHNVFQIILMVIVVILAQRLPCSASDSNKYGKHLLPWTHGGRHLESLASNDPSALFDELARQKPAKSFPKWQDLMNVDQAKSKEKDKTDDMEEAQQLLLPLSLSAASNDVRQEEQRKRHFERLQNEAADREFAQIMRKLKLKLQRERENESVFKSVYKKDQKHKNIPNFCQKKAKGYKMQDSTTTTKESPSSIPSTSPSTLPTPSTMCPAISQPSKCKNREHIELKPEDVECLLKTVMTMKGHALLILKNLKLMELEILRRWPGSCVPSDDAQDESLSTTTNIPKTTTDPPERLERPTTPMPKSYKNGFYFGLRAHGEREANIAMREQRKLEQKVREEYQTQLDRAEWQRHQLQRLKSKRKRARFDAAPSAAVRLELMTTQPSNIVDNKATQKNPYAKHSSAAVKGLAFKVKMYADRNHIDLTRQPLHSWKMMRKFQRKRMNNLGPLTRESLPLSDKKIIPVVSAQNQQTNHNRITQGLH